MPVAAGLYYFAHEEDNLRRPPVLLIHGSGGTHLHWPAEVRRLPGQRVFAIDLPGHGKSDGLGHQSVLEYARAIAAFMDKLKLGPAVMVGHSLGGAIALTLALRFPKRALGLGLVGTGARLRVAPAILENAANPATFPSAVQAAVEMSYGPGADPRLKELGAQRMAETRPSVLHGDFLACNEFDVMDKLEKIDVPALILCGTEDRLTPVKYAEYLRDHLSKARLQTVEGAGHMLPLEQPAAAAAALGEFMAAFADAQIYT
jgi:pimeloyl-ACP methyl ester carboxylesterase